MTESSRGWRQYGLVAGIATLAGVFLWRRFRSSGRDSATAGGDLGSVAVDDGVGSEAVDDEVVTERHAAAFLVRRRLDADGLDADALEGIVAEVRRRVAEDDPDWLLGVDAATTASLFLDRTAQPELVWYVEVPRSVTATWDDPETVLADAFPVDHDAVRPETEPVDREMIVHAVHPNRPRAIEPTDRAVLAGPELASERTVDVELVRMDLNSGLPGRFADWMASLSRRVIDGELELGPIETWSQAMIEAEEMYTESVFLERRPDGYSLFQYMETEEMEHVYDVYYDTWNPVARISEVVLGRILANPDDVLSYPLETEFEPLAHAIDPDRFRRPSKSAESVE
ncbi:DUF6176 family protein [Natrialba swarupiae]|uniref:DUF6176 family protein n=1 Tax=Natrialba swarupiae TaxID=2448032 RepID=UPI00192E671F|nr:DUF6176 family protein [Natrialba swarupiae]